MIYLDTANIEEIKTAMRTNILSGVTTNPSLLLKEKTPRETIVNDILSVSVGEVFVQTKGWEAEEIMEDAEAILETFQSERIALKIPAHLEGIQSIKKLKERRPDVKILATAIYSTEQGLLAALAGSDHIAPYINRMENNTIDAYEVIRNTRKIYDDQGLKTKILAASFKNSTQIVQTLAAGAHAVTVSSELFAGMANKQLALEAIETFNEDANALKTLEGDVNA